MTVQFPRNDFLTRQTSAKAFLEDEKNGIPLLQRRGTLKFTSTKRYVSGSEDPFGGPPRTFVAYFNDVPTLDNIVVVEILPDGQLIKRNIGGRADSMFLASTPQTSNQTELYTWNGESWWLRFFSDVNTVAWYNFTLDPGATAITTPLSVRRDTVLNNTVQYWIGRFSTGQSLRYFKDGIELVFLFGPKEEGPNREIVFYYGASYFRVPFFAGFGVELFTFDGQLYFVQSGSSAVDLFQLKTLNPETNVTTWEKVSNASTIQTVCNSTNKFKFWFGDIDLNENS